MTTGNAPRRGPGGPRRDRDTESRDSGFVEKIVNIRRVAKVVKGGRHFSFNAIAVVGDDNGKVGLGYGKGEEVPDAVHKASLAARKRMMTVPMRGRTVTQQITASYGASTVMIKPAAPGTGLIAGGGVRAVLEAVGVRDVLTKSLGSSNPINVVRATYKALEMMRDPQKEMDQRKARAEAAAHPAPPPARQPVPPAPPRVAPPAGGTHG